MVDDRPGLALTPAVMLVMVSIKDLHTGGAAATIRCHVSVVVVVQSH